MTRVKIRKNGTSARFMRTEWFRPYKNGIKTSLFDHIPAKSKAGVYVVRSDSGRILYVGHSKTQIYATLYRHYQRWNDPAQRRFTFSRYATEVCVYLPAGGVETVFTLEQYLIGKLTPKYGADKLVLQPGEIDFSANPQTKEEGPAPEPEEEAPF